MRRRYFGSEGAHAWRSMISPTAADRKSLVDIDFAARAIASPIGAALFDDSCREIEGSSAGDCWACAEIAASFRRGAWPDNSCGGRSATGAAGRLAGMAWPPHASSVPASWRHHRRRLAAAPQCRLGAERAHRLMKRVAPGRRRAAPGVLRLDEMSGESKSLRRCDGANIISHFLARGRIGG